MNSKVILLSICLLAIVSAHEHSHTYETNEEVVIWMNTVGPYHNRQETYSYFSLPFCAGPKKDIGHYHETLGEALQGIELEFSGLDLDFKRNVPVTKFCEVTLTEEMHMAFVYAVKNQYWYQMYIDDLPIWGLVGEMGAGEKEGEPAYFVYTHKRLDLGYNGEKIVDVNLTVSEKVQLKVGAKLSFSYEANWWPSSIVFSERFTKYLDPNFFQHRIHWFSIFNSFMMVIFLVGLVSMILMRTLRKDYARYSNKEADDFDDLERDLGDEYGWKQVHGDVFRAPSRPALFATLVGNGHHVAAVMLIVVLLTIVGEYYTERGSFLSAILFVYSACAPINGFFGGSLYARLGGKRWIRQMLMGALTVPGCAAVVSSLVSAIALAYHSARSIGFTTTLALLAICLFVLLPLNLIGCVLGRNVAGAPNWPCRVNAVPRPIPEKKWFLEPVLIVLLGGVLPFGSIFIEMYFVFTSFWAYKIYYVFGFMLLVVIIMFAVVACVTVVCTYFLLNSEDYRWHWTSFAAGASTAFYVYLYSVYYYLFKTKMFGLFQTTFYFSYMALFCVALGVMCGTVGYVSSSLFVRKIYSTVKID